MSKLSFADVFNMDRETADNPPVIQVRPQVAEVVTGNTLTMQFRRVRYTPVYYFNDFEKRLADLNRYRAMLEFMRGIQEAA